MTSLRRVGEKCIGMLTLFLVNGLNDLQRPLPNFFWLITSRDTVRGWRKSLFLCSYLLSEVHGIEFSIEIEIRTGENDSLRDTL
jgi:hypothetical protein